ncbi:hypothetical protein C7H19_15205 [Aphanothece hegewaldii CCALA 016]|uniref:Uncharacterized protein n=1 Tax=Aphanothece hegewaldii CCALA 016 TaxID=2107694 RepID=A0A2T1LVL1_9CHRO|nr:hypothetical protein C7H19_15205 [Aphanothece hegewaldii CCALA 016]
MSEGFCRILKGFAGEAETLIQQEFYKTSFCHIFLIIFEFNPIFPFNLIVDNQVQDFAGKRSFFAGFCRESQGKSPNLSSKLLRFRFVEQPHSTPR